MKRLLPILIFTSICSSVFAQSEKEKKAYADEAAHLQTEIWGNSLPEFNATKTPTNLDKESAVILARSYSMSRASNGKIKFGRALTFTTRTTKFSIFHERVKINDKSALEGFATLEYQKRLDQSKSELFAKFVNENKTYIGAKVIKPSGKEVMINTSEEVLIKNESKDQKGKLAIPDLQVGDILDYYICKEDVADKDDGNTYKDNDNLFFLVDEYPMLYYSLDFQFNKKLKVKTIYANGAQHFEENQNADGDQLLSLKLHDVPKYMRQLWTSPYREYPYIEIGSAYDDDLDKIIHKNKFEGNTVMFDAQKTVFENGFIEIEYPYHSLETKYRDYFKDKKALKNISLDSSMKVLYNVWKYDVFCQYALRDLEDFPSVKLRAANSKVNATNVCMVLTNLKVNFDILLVASRNSNSLENVFGYSDFDACIRINGDKPMYMFFDDIANHFDEIPERYQGEKVIVLHPKRRSASEYSFTEESGVLPVISADKNVVNEQLNVSFTQQDMQKLKIGRVVKETGAMRHDDQKVLMGVDDIDDGMKSAAKGQDIDARYKNYIGRDIKKFIAGIKDALVKEGTEKSQNFNKEIKSKYDQEPQQVSDCKIVNKGLDLSQPVFEFNETFVLNNMVKRAGSNYIVDVGKLTGGFLKLEEKDKKRNKDVYMTAARTFKYNIVIDIPAGYAVKGVEELTQNKSNKTGAFSSSAVVNGNKLIVTASRVYNNNFEKAADWPSMVDMITAASDFESKKILFEKQN